MDKNTFIIHSRLHAIGILLKEKYFWKKKKNLSVSIYLLLKPSEVGINEQWEVVKLGFTSLTAFVTQF